MRKVFPFLSLFLLSLLLTACAVNPVTGKRELALVKVTEEEEVKLGARSFAPISQSMGGFYRDEALEEYVAQVGRRLARVSHRPHLKYTFKIVNSSVVNAFALPGGFIAVNRGLLVNLSSEAELAAVLGHEIGHVTARHAVAAYQRSILWNVALLGVAVAGGARSGAVMDLSRIGLSLIENGYSREQERESDYLGVDYMVRAGYNPRGAIDLQEFFYEKFEKGKDPLWVEGLFRTHPFSRERLENIRRYVNERYPDALDNPRFVIGEGEYLQRTEGIRKVQKAYDIADEGDRLLREKKLSAALAKFREAMEREPNQAPFPAKVGLVHLLREEYSTARRYLEQSVLLDPEYALGRLYLGIDLYELGKTSESVLHLEKSMELMPTKIAARYLARAHRRLGNLEKAREYEKIAK
ncbi:MAG: peptidase M48 [Deltaproteobacteria bacterium]|nr:MAG: peptidase M48 [Deltaproteobacteria bacterium]